MRLACPLVWDLGDSMCMQCMAGASVAMGGATGMRAWLATRGWMTPAAMRRATITLLAGGVIASATLVGGATPPPQGAAAAAPAAQAQR